MQSPKIDPSLLQQITKDFSIFKSQDSLLGRGAFGSVYKGYCRSLDKVIAVKHIQVDQNYQREIDTLKILSTLVHPNIMGFYGFQQRKNDVYMFIQLCQNGNLTEIITKGLTQTQVLKYFRQMVQGMCYMNAKSKMHRDLKPDNILIGNNFDLKISDFGLARQSDNIMITGHKGTPLYAAPQVFSMSQQKYTSNCDVWGGGLMLYEMITGQRLFNNVKTQKQLRQQWQAYAKGAKRVKYDQTIHPLFQYFTNIMLTYDAKKRPSYHQVLDILKKSYKKMQTQIQNKSFKNKNNQKLNKLQNYLNYEYQKYQILLKITEYNKKQYKLQIKQPVIYGLTFINICIYLTHMKKLIRELINKNIELPDCDQELIQDQKKDFQIVLCMDKYINLLQTLYTYYSNLLKTQIIKKIQENINQKFYSQTKINQMIIDVQKGMFGVEDGYVKKNKEIVASQWVKMSESKLNANSQDTLKLYSLILLGANMKKIFPEDKYNTENYVKNYVDKLLSLPKNDLITKIRQL